MDNPKNNKKKDVIIQLIIGNVKSKVNVSDRYSKFHYKSQSTFKYNNLILLLYSGSSKLVKSKFCISENLNEFNWYWIKIVILKLILI